MIVFDRAHFDAMTGADPALQAEVIALFQDQVQAWESALDDEQKWRDAAHTIKGSARGMGLWALAAACERAEGATESAAPRAGLRLALGEALAALATSQS
jgi:HPt (histidine-containing phosphotransfer) domain-containing protein